MVQYHNCKMIWENVFGMQSIVFIASILGQDFSLGFLKVNFLSQQHLFQTSYPSNELICYLLVVETTESLIKL